MNTKTKLQVTPHPYRIGRQATELAARDIAGSWLAARMDRFLRNTLLRAYRKHGNKTHAAVALGITYRSFRYHWARLLLDAGTKPASSSST